MYNDAMPGSRGQPARAASTAAAALILLTSALAVPMFAVDDSYATPTRTCRPPRYPGLGYFTSLTVTHVSCATGVRIAIHYYRCRLRQGGVRGRCSGGVDGFRCRETRVSIPTEIDARVTCKRGRTTVVHTYQQNT